MALFSSVHSVVSDSLRPHGLSTPGLPVHHQSSLVLPEFTCPPRVYPNSCPLSQWCHPTFSSSALPFSSCPLSFPASESFQMCQFFTSGGQSIEISASASVYPGLISFRMDWLDLLAVQGTLKVFSNNIVQKHQFFGTQLSL